MIRDKDIARGREGRNPAVLGSVKNYGGFREVTQLSAISLPI